MSEQLMLAAQALAKLPEFAEIGNNLLTQNNRCTDQPIFVVQEASELCFDPEIGGPGDEADRIAWVDDEGNEADGRRFNALEARYERDYTTEWKGWSRRVVGIIYKTDQPFFTEAAAKQYLKINGHNIKRPRIYATGSFRNAEFQLIRSLLIEVGKASTLREAAPEPATVAVDAGALDQLRVTVEAYDKAWAGDMPQRQKIAALQMAEAARRLLAGCE